MKASVLFILACTMSLHAVFAQKNNSNKETQTTEVSFLELPRIQVIPISDTMNDRQYELYIKLPEGYSKDSSKRHPVIYYTDALWHVEILSGSAEYIMEEAILVGISWQKDIADDLKAEVGEHVSRHRDYSVSPSSDSEIQAKYKLGQASKHLDFIRNHVIPYVENNYITDSSKRTYFGYSAGGLFGAYILSAKPDTFRNYIIGSPSLWRDIPYLSELAPDELNANVFISHGTLEDKLSEHVNQFVTMLNNKKDESLILQHEVIEGSHQTAFPLTAVRGVTWLSELMKTNE